MLKMINYKSVDGFTESFNLNKLVYLSKLRKLNRDEFLDCFAEKIKEEDLNKYTVIHLTDEDLITVDSMKTILARIGE